MTNQTETTEPKAPTEAGGQVERVVRWRRDAAPYVARGLKCELWGRKVADMNRDDLIAFIGFLDELATVRFRNQPSNEQGDALAAPERKDRE